MRPTAVLCTAVAMALVALPAMLAAQSPSTLSLNDAMLRAIEANRTLLAARTARAIDVAGIQAARQRPNPEVSFEAENHTRDPAGEDGSRRIYTDPFPAQGLITLTLERG